MCGMPFLDAAMQQEEISTRWLARFFPFDAFLRTRTYKYVLLYWHPLPRSSSPGSSLQIWPAAALPATAPRGEALVGLSP